MKNKYQNLIYGSISSSKGTTKVNSWFKDSETRKIELTNAFRKMSHFDIIWYAIFISLAGLSFFTFVWRDPWIILTTINMLCYLISCNLIAKGNVLGLFLSIAENLTYAVICFNNQVYGDLIKNVLICVPLNVLAIISWNKDLNDPKRKETKKELRIRKLTMKGRIILCVGVLLLAILLYYPLILLKTNKALIGAFLFSITITAKLLSSGRFMENWYVSTVGSFVGAVMWAIILIEQISAGNFANITLIISYCAVLSNNINGICVWNKLYRKNTVNGSVNLAMRKVEIYSFIKARGKYKKLKWNEKVDKEKNS